MISICVVREVRLAMKGKCCSSREEGSERVEVTKPETTRPKASN